MTLLYIHISYHVLYLFFFTHIYNVRRINEHIYRAKWGPIVGNIIIIRAGLSGMVHIYCCTMASPRASSSYWLLLLSCCLALSSPSCQREVMDPSDNKRLGVLLFPSILKSFWALHSFFSCFFFVMYYYPTTYMQWLYTMDRSARNSNYGWWPPCWRMPPGSSVPRHPLGSKLLECQQRTWLEGLFISLERAVRQIRLSSSSDRPFFPITFCRICCVLNAD